MYLVLPLKIGENHNILLNFRIFYKSSTYKSSFQSVIVAINNICKHYVSPRYGRLSADPEHVPEGLKKGKKGEGRGRKE